MTIQLRLIGTYFFGKSIMNTCCNKWRNWLKNSTVHETHLRFCKRHPSASSGQALFLGERMRMKDEGLRSQMVHKYPAGDGNIQRIDAGRHRDSGKDVAFLRNGFSKSPAFGAKNYHGITGWA
jgi:hypothetical protein